MPFLTRSPKRLLNNTRKRTKLKSVALKLWVKSKKTLKEKITCQDKYPQLNPNK